MRREPRDAYLKIYNIDQFGFYKRGSEEPEFGDLPSTLREIRRWTNGVSKRSTKTFDAHPEGKYLPVYCHDVYGRNTTGDFILTTWNEIPSEEGNVMAIDLDDRVGDAKIDAVSTGGGCPGYPTTFWFIPEYKIVVCVRFTGRETGMQGLQRFFRGYLSKLCKHVRTNDDGDIIGYSADANSEPEMMKPKFSIIEKRVRSDVEYIQSNVHLIQEMLKKSSLDLEVPEQKSNLLSMLKIFSSSFRAVPNTDQEIKHQIRMKYQPTERELNQIITNWESDADDSGWDDLGFKLQGESQPRWLTRSIASEKVEVRPRMINTRCAEAESLVRELEQFRNRIIDQGTM